LSKHYTDNFFINPLNPAMSESWQKKPNPKNGN
jgi:hypothetical protein